MVGNPQEEFEHIDADAVCEACANVNPTGTLLCKVCGNNLRDQRVRRMQAGGPAEVKQPATIQIGRILRGVGAVLAIAILGIMALNVKSIEQWMTGVAVQAETSEAVRPDVYWNGPDASRFAQMLENIAFPVTAAQASVLPSGTAATSFDGFYILKLRSDPSAPVFGAALVQAEGQTLYFAAKLAGGTEIRGVGTQNSPRMAEAINIGSRDPDGTTIGAYGLAQIQATGEITCTGMFEGEGEQDFSVDAIAIPVPLDSSDIAVPAQLEAPREALVDPIEAVDAAAEAAAAAESAVPAQP